MRALAEASDAPLYNMAAVVQRTGVPATTIRAWERRYAYPQPGRAHGGRRLYSERDIQAIRWLADQTSHGVAISRAVAMLRGGYAAPEPAVIPAPAPRSFAAVRSDLLQALLGLDLGQAEATLAEAFALFSVEDVCLHVFEPLLVEVGERWHAAELSVAEEHYISAFVRGHLFALLAAYQRPAVSGPLVLTACAPDEWHEMGILLVSIFLARRGAAVRYLGPNLPLESLGKVIALHPPAVVILSAQSRETARQLRRGARVLLEVHPRPRLAFGGQAFNAEPALREGLPGIYVGPTAAATAEQVGSMLRSLEQPSRPSDPRQQPRRRRARQP